jgi:excinuclease ABC subunit B
VTKRTAEKLTDYLWDTELMFNTFTAKLTPGARGNFTFFRRGGFDVLVGLTFARRPRRSEVSLVAILDADKEGFLRSATSLIQTAGRAARNLNGRVILYCDVMTDSIKKFLAVSEYRRKKQLDYNIKHGITPRSVTRPLEEGLLVTSGLNSSSVRSF